MNTNRKLKNKSSFITEAIKIMKADPNYKLSARSVAEAAGFNAGSIYNYFDGMDHLENTASIYFTEDYALDLSRAAKKADTGLEVYIVMWEIFLKHAFKKPFIFYNVFYSAIAQTDKHNLFKEYYEMFPDKYPHNNSLIELMLNLDKTQNRGKFVLDKCVEEGSIKLEHLEYINHIHIGYTKMVLNDIVKSDLYRPSKKLYHQTLIYIIYSMYYFVREDHREVLNEKLDFHKIEIEAGIN